MLGQRPLEASVFLVAAGEAAVGIVLAVVRLAEGWPRAAGDWAAASFASEAFALAAVLLMTPSFVSGRAGLRPY